MAQAPPVYNPKQAAQGMANAEYNPAIASLKQALLDVMTQGKYDQGQLKGYYGQMSHLMNAQNAEQGANQQAELANISQNMGNVAQLFGAQNAQQMQPAYGNAAGLIGAEGKSEQDYLSNMLPLLKAQGAQGSSELSHTVMAQQRNYNDQLVQQQKAKGAAYNADYQQALANQTQQQQNQLALQQAKAMFGPQLTAAKAQAKADKVNAQYAGKYNQARIRSENASAQASAARAAAITNEQQSTIAKNMAEARAAVARAKASNQKANPLAPGSTTFNRIQSGLYQALTKGGKGPIANPMFAQRALFAEAVSQGLITRQGKPLVHGSIKLLNATLAEMYNRNQHWQAGWKWNGRKFVPR